MQKIYCRSIRPDGYGEGVVPEMSADYQKIEKWELRLKDLISGVASSSSDGWISVQERLPELPPAYQEDGMWLRTVSSVCIAFDGENVFESSYDAQGFTDKSITHWQYRPKPPNTI